MPVLKLTKSSIKALVATVKPVSYFDTELKGFGLKVFPSGERRWIFEYRPGAGGRGVAKRRMVLGGADTITPDEARDLARKAQAQVRLGADPVEEKNRLRDSATVADLIEMYMADEIRPLRKASTAALYKIYMDRHIEPAIGARKAVLLSQIDVARLHRSIGAVQKVTANRVLAFLHAAYMFGIDRKLLPPDTENPAAGIEKYTEASRERYLSEADFARLGEAIRKAETVGIDWRPSDADKPNAKHTPKEGKSRLGPHAAAAIRLLIFTGARLREILHLRWGEVDLERGVLQLPDSKTGKKTMLLTAPAVEILAALPRVGTYVIAGDHPQKPRSDLKRPWELVSREAGLAGVRLHDLRHSFASVGVNANLGLPMIGKLLGHANASTTERYAHIAIHPLQQSGDLIAKRIASAMGEALP